MDTELNEGRFPFRVDPSFLRTFPDADLKATECVINLLLTDVILMGPHSRLLRPFGLSLGTLNLLEVLNGAGEPLPPSVLAERMMTTRSTITKLVDSLEQHGRVRRCPHPQDRRMLLVDITDDGRGVLAELMPVLHRDEREWMSCLRDDEKETLVRLLGKIQAHLFAPFVLE